MTDYPYGQHISPEQAAHKILAWSEDPHTTHQIFIREKDDGEIEVAVVDWGPGPDVPAAIGRLRRALAGLRRYHGRPLGPPGSQ